MDDEISRKQVNDSGFPFQIRIEHDVKSGHARHKWFPIGSEHLWTNPDTGADGFIDLVLQKDCNQFYHWVIVMECKRVRQGNWIFISTPENSNDRKVYTLVHERGSLASKGPLWDNSVWYPKADRAMFCTVPGQDNRNTPMLERTCSELLASVEALATQNYHLLMRKPVPELRETYIYIPVVVTNAEIVSCVVTAEDVDPTDAVLLQEVGTFTKVPYIRFQKGFSSRYDTGIIPTSLREANRMGERTVYVVQSSHLTTFLQDLEPL